MNVDQACTIIGGICTLASIWGAQKSIKYYKKSRNLTLFANNNVAYSESQKIVDLFSQLLKFTKTRTRPRGSNIPKAVSQCGEDIRKSLSIIRDKVSAEDYDEIEKILHSTCYDVEKYIDSIIMCSVLENDVFEVDDKYNNAREAFKNVNRFLKRRAEILEETINS